MSRERGLAAFRLESPREVPHTQYIEHPMWLECLRTSRGKPEAGWAELLDFDFVWSVDTPEIGRGRWTDMGHAVYRADGSDFRPGKESPFRNLEEIYSLDPEAEYGRVDLAAQAGKYNSWFASARKGDYVISGGTYNSVVSFAIAAFGWENLLEAAGTDLERFGAVLNRWTDYLMTFVRAWSMTDIEVFHTHDDMTWSQGGIFSPEFYEMFVFSNYRKMWECAKNAGKKVLFTSDGDYTGYVDQLAAAGADGFVFEPLTDLEYVASRFGKTHVIIGNADCRILSFGSGEDVRKEVKRCMDAGKRCPGYFFAVGNHIPPHVPQENADECMRAYFEMRAR